MRMLVLFVCMFSAAAFCAENIIKNPGFEDGASNWIDWPVKNTVSGESPCSGKSAVLLKSKGEGSYCIQRPMRLQKNHLYKFGAMCRKISGDAGIQLLARKTAGGNESASRAAKGRGAWESVCGYYIPSSDEESGEVILFADKEGEAFFDDVFFFDAGPFSPKNMAFSVSSATGGVLSFGTNDVVVRINQNKGCLPEWISSPSLKDENMTGGFNFSVREKDGPSAHGTGIHRSAVSDFSMFESDGVLRLEFQMELKKLALRETFEFYEGRPFFKVVMEFAVLSDCQFGELVFSFSSAAGTSFLLSGAPARANVIKSEPSEKGSWHGVGKFPVNRWNAFYFERLKGGFAVFAPDKKNWMEMTPSFLCNLKNGGFNVNIHKWKDREARAGESVSYEFFVCPVASEYAGFEGRVSSLWREFFSLGD